MDDYSTKIKDSAEHLIRNEFPEKALELDTLVSVCNSEAKSLSFYRFCERISTNY